MENIYIFIFLNILYFINSSSVIIPIESFQSEINDDLSDDSESQSLMSELFHLKMTSTIKIGSESYPLKVMFNINDPYLYISEDCPIKDNFKTNFNYNRYKSQSFYNTSSFDLNFGKSSHACTATENFKVYNSEKKEIQIEKINFILMQDTNEYKPNCLNIGLINNQYKDSAFKEMNLIRQLKQNNYGKEYVWSIIFNFDTKYNNNYLLPTPDEIINLKGELIIGDYPHNLYHKNYFESQLVQTYSIFSENIMKWELEFNKIYYKKNGGKEKVIDDENVKFDPSNYLIIAPNIYFESIQENYFQKYIDDDLCYLNYFNEYISIICDKSDKFTFEESTKFPSIYFHHVDLKYTFELSYKDLFVEKDNLYWFLIISDRLFYTTGWVLGNIFMRKYQFVFNIETKEIMFYNPNEKIDTKNKINEGSSNTILYIILIMV